MAINVFELFAKLKIDSSEFKEGLSEAGDKAKKTIETVGTVLTGAVGAGTTAIVALTKQAVSAYGDYQQNVGGIQKLYGNMGLSLEQYANSVGKSTDEVADKWQSLENAQNIVLRNAQNAYRTAGMSANQYMETATQFSASLISSLGGDTVKSAEMTDIAMTAISDNWNTFGGDLEAITNAYKGFSKQNYTMLDNLKLGYGGTKEEMERLISDANKLGEAYGVTSELSIDSFADIVTAIQAVQKYQNIAGTTAREASTTVSGSLNMAKMAWENLVAGFGNDSADLNQLIKNLVDSVLGYTDEAGEHVNGVVDNLLPVIVTAVTSIATAIDTVIPIISEKLPSLIETLLPTIISGATKLVAGLLNALPQILTVLVNAIPLIFSTLMVATDWSGISSALLTALSSTFGMAINGLNSLIGDVISWMQTAIANGVPQVGFDFINNLVNGILETADTLLGSLDQLLNTAISFIFPFGMQFLMVAMEFIGQMTEGVIDRLPQWITSLGNLINKAIAYLMSNLPLFLQKGIQIVLKIVDGLIQSIPSVLSALLGLVTSMISTIVMNLPQFMTTAGQIVGQLVGGLLNSAGNLGSAVVQLVNVIGNKFRELPRLALGWGRDLIQSFVNGITSMISSVVGAVSGVASKVKSFLHFSEPDEGPLANFHTYAPDMMKLFASGITKNADEIEDAFNDSLDFINKPIDMNAKVTARTSPASSASASNNFGNVTINVYGANDDEKLAEMVMEKLQHITKRKGSAFA